MKDSMQVQYQILYMQIILIILILHDSQIEQA
nr:MAG TPA: hypothetical protein [Caudoviricetes sp.]